MKTKGFILAIFAIILIGSAAAVYKYGLPFYSKTYSVGENFLQPFTDKGVEFHQITLFCGDRQKELNKEETEAFLADFSALCVSPVDPANTIAETDSQIRIKLVGDEITYLHFAFLNDDTFRFVLQDTQLKSIKISDEHRYFKLVKDDGAARPLLEKYLD